MATCSRSVGISACRDAITAAMQESCAYTLQVAHAASRDPADRIRADGSSDCDTSAMGRFKDDDLTKFVAMESDDGTRSYLSRAAMKVHVDASRIAKEAGHEGFISDDYLASVETDTATVAAELCVAGFWQRVEGGYTLGSKRDLPGAMGS